MKSYSSPALYMQGQNILSQDYDQITCLGHRAIILSNGIAVNVAAEPLCQTLNTQNLVSEVVVISDHFNDHELTNLTALIKERAADIVIAVGGGKVIDISKIVAAKIDCQLVIVPTLASTDAPTSRLSATYNAQGHFENYIFFDRSPSLVMVDTDIIVNAPTRTLIAGIADALATFVEYRAVKCAHGQNMFGDKATIAAGVLAEQATKTIFREAKLAIKANSAHTVDQHFENVVEEAAHSIANGLTQFVSPTIMHGEKVAFGLLGQLVLSQSSSVLYQKYLKFLRALGLPVCLKDLGLTRDRQTLYQIAQEVLRPNETIHQMNLSLTAADIVNTLLQIDSYAN
ncbi:glycerol dehydrogenase [Leuconostoc citreum]|uniref:glycerol dehydrogenase n=1 Tax=Leuconostoc citreum TaxID=33964 RepID=UPI0015F4E28E|nr:glycerol dehydrogenase [Leuconostoc citreum]MBA5938255.1 glycerol dehydrogenase [Leuconostoc citreum]